MPFVVESYNEGGTRPSRVEATRLVVKDPHGNPLCFVVESEPGVYIVAHQGDDDFDQLLRTVGCRAAVVGRHFHVGD